MNFAKLKSLISKMDKSILFDEYKIRYATERFLMRLNETKYSKNFILKGGFLIGVIYSISNRTTVDLDTLLHGSIVDYDELKEILEEITLIDLNDNVNFSLLGLKRHQDTKESPGFRAKLQLKFKDEQTIIVFFLDIGLGDKITPSVTSTPVPLLFSNESVTLLGYPLETIFAEKVETVLRLGVINTRMKDFYDIHLLLNDPNFPSDTSCFIALHNTWFQRHNQILTKDLFGEWYFILDEIRDSKEMNDNAWPKYKRTRTYAQSIEFVRIINLLKIYLEKLEEILE